MEFILARTSRKIGYTLRFYRRARGLSQMDLAHNAGLSFRNYQRLENGETVPRMDTLLRLAKELKLNPSTLIESLEKEAIGIQDTSASEQELLQLLKIGVSDTKSFAALENLNLAPHQKAELHPFQMDGHSIQISLASQKHFGFPSPTLNLDHHLMGIKSVDFWEFFSRKRLKTAKMINLLRLPTGFQFIESFHYVVSWTPDAPRSFGCLRKCTEDQDLRKWILESQPMPLETDPTATAKK